jgi:anti-repressor protein
MIDALAVTTDEARQGIDARQLHAALGIGRDFPTWISEQVSRYGLEDGRDFSPVSGKSTGGRPATEYALSIPAAKLIAISTRGPQALKARAALIQIEEQWNSPSAVMARAVILAHAENARLRHEREMAISRIGELEPKAAALDAIGESDGECSLQDVGRHLGLPPNKTLWRIEEDGILFRGSHGTLTPRSQWIEAGYFRYVVTTVDAQGRSFGQTKVTRRGLTWLAQRYACTPQALIPQEVH